MIEIIVVSYSNEAPAQPLSAVFGHQGGSIGRSDDNHFVLPDPKHHVSRLQAMVLSDGDRHRITNLSHANPTILNGTELACDTPHPLQVGDEIQIGMYLLRTRAPARPAAQTPQMNHIAAGAGIAIPVPAMVARSRAPEAAASAMPVPGPAHAAPLAATPMASADALVADPAPRRAAAATPATASISTPALPDGTASTDNHALLQAFLNGAGIASITLSSGLTPEFMETVGALLATAIDGTVDLIGMRASVKREVNADVTMVVVRNNNPLKFLPDGATVLTQMLRKRMPGFMGPVDAMHDAFDDLHAHQLGLLAGMQASMRDVHRQLDPAAIAADGTGSSRMERLFPVNRKAALWDRYCNLHQQLAAAPLSAAQILSGKAFLSAYEKASDDYLDEASNAR